MSGYHRQRRPYAARHQSPYPSKRFLAKAQFLAMFGTLAFAWVVLMATFVRALIG